MLINYITKPPFTEKTCPVIKDDFSLARKRRVLQTSSQVPIFPRGVSDFSELISSSVK